MPIAQLIVLETVLDAREAIQDFSDGTANSLNVTGAKNILTSTIGP
jgi:hypothetical protein